MTRKEKIANEKNYRCVTFSVEDAERLGLHAAILLSEMKRYYLMMNISDDWFYVSNESLMEGTALTYKQILREIKSLELKKVIQKKIIGYPPKRYFKIIKGGS